MAEKKLIYIHYSKYLYVHIIYAFLPLPLCLLAQHPFVSLQVLRSTCHSTTAVLQHPGALLYSTLAASHSTLLHVLTALQLYLLQHSGRIAAHYCIHLLLQYCSCILYSTPAVLQHTAACLYNTLVALQNTAASTYYCSTLLYVCTTLWLHCSTLLRPFTALRLNCSILPQRSIHAPLILFFIWLYQHTLLLCAVLLLAMHTPIHMDAQNT